MKETNQQFKQSFSGSVGSGIGALVNASGKRYYILEHKVTSQYHKAGESQPIIIDEITIGRDPKCQVRFDESFGTVSRMHAAIKKEGENYVLIQMSKTNTTYLNGVPVKDRWYLQNGDEIQLSTNGPKLGFIIPQGEKSMVKSIGLSARLSLFRKQALAPYKKAVVALSIFLVLAIAGGVTLGVIQGGKIKDLTATLDDYKTKITKVLKDNEGLSETVDSLRITLVDPIVIGPKPQGDLTALVAGVKGSVCYLQTDVYVEMDGEKELYYSYSGSAFLLKDGTLVTARHCVEPWLFPSDEEDLILNAMSTMGVAKVYSVLKAYYGNDCITLTNKDFKQDRSNDETYDIEDGVRVTIAFPGLISEIGSPDMFGADWAMAKTTRKGIITADYEASASLKAGEKLYVLGFPRRLGVKDGERLVEPIFNELSVARDGLNNGGCIMITAGTDHGNSGGPVFAKRNGKLVAVGIVSHGDNKSDQYGHLVPIRNIRR